MTNKEIVNRLHKIAQEARTPEQFWYAYRQLIGNWDETQQLVPLREELQELDAELKRHETAAIKAMQKICRKLEPLSSQEHITAALEEFSLADSGKIRVLLQDPTTGIQKEVQANQHLSNAIYARFQALARVLQLLVQHGHYEAIKDYVVVDGNGQFVKANIPSFEEYDKAKTEYEYQLQVTPAYSLSILEFSSNDKSITDKDVPALLFIGAFHKPLSLLECQTHLQKVYESVVTSEPPQATNPTITQQRCSYDSISRPRTVLTIDHYKIPFNKGKTPDKLLRIVFANEYSACKRYSIKDLLFKKLKKPFQTFEDFMPMFTQFVKDFNERLAADEYKMPEFIKVEDDDCFINPKYLQPLNQPVD